MMQRVYGLAFETGNSSRKNKDKRSLAMQRDHRKFNSKLRYFTISDEVGKGLPLWMPNGTVIRDELEKLAREKEFLADTNVYQLHISQEMICILLPGTCLITRKACFRRWKWMENGFFSSQ
ncbi:MAG: hypothetical protein CM1200mP28_09820 [Deltaproteobacteria bacterium]|nr:MAG: hypothetical protein CM1200mP28_09820 [Deltaproteobacteria bacterium]